MTTWLGITVAWLCILMLMRVAYRNGVRDGYQNHGLPHVQKQIKEEGLKRNDGTGN